MHKEELPLVSCIMPTYNRREFIPHAIRYFLQQDYENKELIIIDDGTDMISDLIPDNQYIRYFYLEKKITLGAKLNLACRYAAGRIIVHWDDDDWYAPRRLSYQVESLQNNNADVCGINRLLYYDLLNKKALQYIYPANQRVWLLGSSLCYKKELWKNQQFADINVGMDGLFVWATAPDRVAVLPDATIAVHMIHNRNISPKKTEGGWWHAYQAEEIKKVMGDDWELYSNNKSGIPLLKANDYLLNNRKKNNSQKLIKNIHACLVHEEEECIIDMVRNLHYHDPASTILLYNGSGDSKLLKNNFPYGEFGAIIHPHPRPMKLGYLHNFALDCMKYCIENFSFDTITIVDSDQLCIRKGYTEYLSSFLYDKPEVGMLSNKQERIDVDDTTNQLAIPAFKEYQLWKPLLKTFPDGEKHFLHWTFWPSTVFTSSAARDLVQIFRDNKLLGEIMGQTKIWATEEIILPTLVRLMGYKIALNPCSHNFVRYRKPIQQQEIDVALKTDNVYWIHPVERNYKDPFRILIRDKCGGYLTRNKTVATVSETKSFHPVTLVNSIRNVQGWLSDKEAELLISATMQGFRLFKTDININLVEIGSYHGKSTIIFGTIIKNLYPHAKLTAIDPHDGKLGDEDQGLKIYPPSFEMFKSNINNAGITDVVEIFRTSSTNIMWEAPVSLLFIDGLHDYRNVSRDFKHFSQWIVAGGYVIFHDYADYFPGVKLFVDELLQSGFYKKINMADSLIILQKK